MEGRRSYWVMATETFEPASLNVGSVSAGKLADLNNDGYLDIVAPTGKGGGAGVSLNRGMLDGEWLGFDSPQEFPIAGSSVPQGILGLGHFDDDEYLDIAVADNSLVWTRAQ